uniref:Carn_acyltransf domain-containing protein n=1 Tax=Rhabditophanes sp. KR3021 TaxID=114890 RepID=A0AC35TY71_9BILA
MNNNNQADDETNNVSKPSAEWYNWNDPSLEKPPVPSIQHTLQRYLEYASVVCAGHSDLDFNQTQSAVQEFYPLAEELQKKLNDIALTDENWINRYWLPEMYLKTRYALPLWSNPAYIFPQQTFNTINDQLSFAAWMVRGFGDYQDMIDNQKFPREISTGAVKIAVCMEQYKKVLSSYREPSHDCDIQHYRRNCPDQYNEPGCSHIIVMCINQAFVVYTKINNEILPYSEIYYQLQKVYEFATNRPTATPIGVATCGNRDVAAQFWNVMKKKPINVRSLKWCQSASMVLCLDFLKNCNIKVHSDSYEENLAHRGHHLLHGFGSQNMGLNRWYDSTIQLVVSDTGTNGLIIEHSVAEGIVVMKLGEHVQLFTEKNKHKKEVYVAKYKYDPKPLTWSIDTEAAKYIMTQKQEFDRLASGLNLQLLYFDLYGKEYIKSKKVSPDGYIQLILQLAHFSLHGKLVSTYESASIRRFRHGRVDNIRAATPEALSWVLSMTSHYNKHTDESRKKLFYAAIKKQAIITQENISGHGIDNHLCALNILALENLSHIPKMFEEKTWTETMRFPLSTSQVTPFDIVKDTYLCYGAVVDDGYGCAYNIQPDHLVFAASSYTFHNRADASSFKDAIRKSLITVGKLLE